MKLSIEQQDIDGGIECNPYDCAANRALQRMFPYSKYKCIFIVDSSCITVKKYQGEVRDFDCTEDLCNFIFDYDDSGYSLLIGPCKVDLPENMVEFITGVKENDDDND